jgi:hypothetical protein
MQCLSGARCRQSPTQTPQTQSHTSQPRRSNAATHHGRYCYIQIASEPQTWPKAVPQQRKASEDVMSPSHKGATITVSKTLTELVQLAPTPLAIMTLPPKPL